jgi:ferrochelatase
MPTALLLVNLGTPRSTSVDDVRAYLREFLGDPDVISLPAPIRWLLLEGVILRTRPKKSAAAYKKIWTDRGSPLLFHAEDLLAQVKTRLSPSTQTALAMRYGEPSIGSALKALQAKKVDKICLFPLYPQYARASTKSVVDKVRLEMRRLGYGAAVDVVAPCYDDDAFIDAFVDNGRAALAGFDPDKILMSFHGYPERYLREDGHGHCLPDGKSGDARRERCCDVVVDDNRDCYLRQCKVTSKKIVERLGLDEHKVINCYQSRLQDTWVRPYTDAVVVEAAKAGARRLLVFCPAFVADCLETLEEIALRADEDFRAAGGEALKLVPSLNSQPRWADAVVALARRTTADL